MFVARRRGTTVLLASVVALLALLLSPISAPRADAMTLAPGGLSPAGGASTVATPVLGWQPVAGATRYDVEVSASSAFNLITFAKSTTNTRLVPTVVQAEGEMFWRVRAVDSAGVGPWATANAVVDVTLPPTPLSPANTTDTVLAQPGNPPLLSWTAVNGAVGYQVDVDVDADFIGASSYTTKTTSLVVPDPKADGVYNWRVRAQLGNGLYTSFSAPWSYKIGPLKQVLPTSPGDSESVEDVELRWEPVLGAKTYELQVSTDQDFNTIVDTKVDIKSTTYSPPTTYLNDDYYWRVRARNNQGETFDWNLVTTKRLFQRNWLAQPTPQFPPDSIAPAIGDDLYFQWSPVQHATRYQLDVGTDPNFSTLNVTYRSCFTAATTYTPGYYLPPTNELCMPAQGAVYYWRVRALDDPAGVQGIYSPIRSFVYNSGEVAHTSPADGATVAVPTLTWQSARDAEKYRLIVSNAAGGTVADITTYSLSWTPTGKSPLDPAKGPYSWTVQSIDGDGKLSPRYGAWTFSITGPPASSGLPALTPMAAGPTVRFPALRWEPMPGAATYRIDIGVSGSGFYFEDTYSPILATSYPYASATDTGDKFLSPGEYDWQVEAFDSAGVSVGRGSVGVFTIKDLSPVTGRRLALNGTSLDSSAVCTASIASPATTPDRCSDVSATPVLDWESVPEAAFYRVYLARDRELTNLVYTTIPQTTNSRWTPHDKHSPKALPDSQAGQAYYWYIRPCKTVSICAPDPVSTLAAATNAFSKTSPPVALQEPASGASVTTSQVRFTWDDYRTTNATTTYAATGETGTQSAMQYRIQVSTTRSFATLVDQRVVDQANYTAWDKTYPEGTLYWRVQAIDAAGNGLTWSKGEALPGDPGDVAGRAFTKSSSPPVLKSPIASTIGAVTQTAGSAAFTWEPTTYAGSYQLEVYKNDDTAWSPANRIVNFTSKQAAYAHSIPIPASAIPYVWRVARLDADGRPGQWSETGRFYSAGAAVPLTSPAVGANLSATLPYFSWGAVTGAATYRFERRAQGSASVTESVTTSAQAWAPVGAIAPGNWEWRVVALDANRALLGESPWRSFVAQGVLTSTPRPVISGSLRVGYVLTANTGTWSPAPVTFTYQWFRSGTAVVGATKSTYALTASDLAKTIQVRVIGSKPAYVPITTYSLVTSPVGGGTLSPTPTPAISGVVRIGNRLTALPGTWGPAPVTLSYQWYRSGMVITGATASTYLPTAADLGKRLVVRVTARKTGFLTVAKSSASTVAVALGVLTKGTPTVTGTKRVGYTLTASPGVWTPSPVTLSYQWYRSGVAISGATRATYKLVTADLGKGMSVRVTGRKTAYATATRDSARTTAITR